MHIKKVVAALIVENKKILIARRAPGQSHALRWEFPGGKIEANETPEKALTREILEELGLHITVGNFCATNTFQYKDFLIELSAYWATLTTTQQPVLTVHDDVKFLLPEELLGYDLTEADIPILHEAVRTFASLQNSKATHS
jgi:8-oxo-dGTP diphosphatase